MPELALTNNVFIGDNHPAFIIAEAGINHQGDIIIAKQLIDVAVASKANCVKFQKRTISRIMTKAGLDAAYISPNSFGATYGEHKRALEFNEADFYELSRYAASKNILFTASGWDEESVDFLDSVINVPFFKMASADLTNLPLLIHTAKKQKPMIISTGMADLETVRTVYATVSAINPRIVLLQCTSSYPTPISEINLNVIQMYKREFPNTVIGFSGHENGIAISLAAVVMGAAVIERHFTLDRTMKGGDHAASLEPVGLTKLIRDIRMYEQARGSDVKKLEDSEKPCFLKLTKSVVSACPILKNTEITRNMLTTKGPGISVNNNGISPMQLESIVGKMANCDIPNDIIINKSWISN